MIDIINSIVLIQTPAIFNTNFAQFHYHYSIYKSDLNYDGDQINQSFINTHTCIYKDMHTYKHAYNLHIFLHIYRNILQFVSIRPWILFDILISVVSRITVVLECHNIHKIICLTILVDLVCISDLICFSENHQHYFSFFIWLFHYCSLKTLFIYNESKFPHKYDLNY